jgi:short-subunit dehydrogenase
LNILITGASTGIGYQLALDYGRQGHSLWLLARSKDKLEALGAEIEAAGGKATVMAGDVSNIDEMLVNLTQADVASGGMDLVIANAGISARMRYPGSESLSNARRVLDINFTAAVICLEFFMQRMIPRRSGHLVGIGSIAGFRGLPGHGPYSAAKAGLHTYLESLRFSGHQYGIKVTDIRPGFVRTPLVANNRQPMPFILSVEAASRRIRRAIEKGRKRYTFPRIMAFMGWFLRVSPNFLTDFILGLALHSRAVSGAPIEDR